MSEHSDSKLAATASESWTTIIQRGRPRARSTWAELWAYRELTWLLFRRDFVAMYKQTVLGPLWFLLQPLMTSTAFTIVFGKIANIPTDGVNPFLFYLGGVVPWTYFAGCLTATAGTFIANAAVFGKVYFPRFVVPVALLMTNLVTFFIQFALFAVLYVVLFARGAAFSPNASLALVPFLIGHLAALGLGVGLIVAALTTKYRDLAMVLNFAVQLWLYGSPVAYPLSQVSPTWRWVFLLNPVAAVVEAFRFAFFSAGTGVRASDYALSLAMTTLVLSCGVRMFRRAERTFLDTI